MYIIHANTLGEFCSFSRKKNHKVEKAVSFATLIPWRMAEQKCLTHIIEEPCLILAQRLNIMTKTFCCKFPCFHGGECSDLCLHSCDKNWVYMWNISNEYAASISGFKRMWWWRSRLQGKQKLSSSMFYQNVGIHLHY